MSFTESKIINLHSSNGIKNNGSFLSDVYFPFTGILKEDPTILEVNLSLQSAQIPFSFYNINIYNNTLDITYNSILYNLQLTRGNYNANNLITELLNQLQPITTTLQITISPITGKLLFNDTSLTNYTIESTSTILKVLGFEVNTSYTSTLGQLTPPFPLNLLGTLNIKITSSEIAVSNIDSVVGGNYNILASLPIEAGNFGLILYDNISNIQSPLKNISLDGFDIKLLDDDNNLINFNNCDWSITIVLNITRERQEKSKSNLKSIVKPIYELIDLEKKLLEIQLSTNVDQPPDAQDQQEVDQQEVDQQEVPQPEEQLDDENNLDVLIYNRTL
jgi:hypothetical protein